MRFRFGLNGVMECFSGIDAETGISAAVKERVAVIFNLFSESIKHLSPSFLSS